MRKFLALLFALLLCTATKVYAEDTATVTVTIKDLPQKLQNRTVIVTLGNGPSDTESTVIVLDGLNNYTAMVTVAPSEYYCAAAVQYDALGDYPLQEINQTTFLQAEGGNHYDLIYTLMGSSWYESVTGQQRHYTLQPLETPPENYEPEPAQVGAYLTAPIGFSQHVIVYLFMGSNSMYCPNTVFDPMTAKWLPLYTTAGRFESSIFFCLLYLYAVHLKPNCCVACFNCVRFTPSLPMCTTCPTSTISTSNP